MFLTLALLRKGIPGRQWIGKWRRPRPVTWQMKQNTLKRLECEAQNEYWLSRPYINLEQERGHAHARRTNSWETIRQARQSIFPKHTSITKHLQHLNITRQAAGGGEAAAGRADTYTARKRRRMSSRYSRRAVKQNLHKILGKQLVCPTDEGFQWLSVFSHVSNSRTPVQRRDNELCVEGHRATLCMEVTQNSDLCGFHEDELHRVTEEQEGLLEEYLAFDWRELCGDSEDRLTLPKHCPLEQSPSPLPRPHSSSRRRPLPPRTLTPLMQSSTATNMEEVIRGTRLSDFHPATIQRVNAEITHICASMANVHLAHHPNPSIHSLHDNVYLRKDTVHTFAKNLKDAALGRNPDTHQKSHKQPILHRPPNLPPNYIRTQPVGYHHYPPTWQRHGHAPRATPAQRPATPPRQPRNSTMTRPPRPTQQLQRKS
ncbi:Ribosomal protein 63, mitochondrial [Bagarius yarrelli]|uniref:Ribosomal protein 63, mitochondrial n=1 Tax=Bagarius yarrelli TaxID=175774 RepID=A0A556VA16_BAGYA|nr:Ribosomal protein 63, mitochondrial [Bagarius yarrelli]